MTSFCSISSSKKKFFFAVPLKKVKDPGLHSAGKTTAEGIANRFSVFVLMNSDM
jgi:hypothetical protein